MMLEFFLSKDTTKELMKVVMKETDFKEKITFIGALNYRKQPTDGETAKNQIILNYFHKKYVNLKFIDTYKWKSRPFVFIKLFIEIFIFRKRKLIISICPNSADRISRILFFSNTKRILYYFVIGGNFAERIREKKYNAKYYHQYKKIFVEGKIMLQTLNEVGFNNIEYLPNFKDFDITILNAESKNMNNNSKVKYVFLSRIVEDKGVTLILEAINNLNAEGFSNLYDVTFYGPISESYEINFKKTLSQHANIKYDGYLDLQTNEGYKKLGCFDLMLFPTFWQGEGFPGILIDAMIAGVPVIASNWNFNSEIIINNYNGYLIKPKDVNDLYKTMKKIIFDRSDLLDMSNHCKQKALEYQVDHVLEKIVI